MIDWKSRISEDDKYIDMTGLPYYHLEFNDKCTWEIIHDIKVRMPVEPPDDHCVNYGLSIDDQIFRKTLVPKQVANPSKDYGRENWTKAQKDSFVDSEYNRRNNGLWMFIKGRKYFIPGQLWFKMNHWTSITSEPFSYRDHERKFFSLALQVQRDPIDLGIIDFKCRQLGDTENALVIIYERGSRIRGGLATMQSFVGETHVFETYGRLIHGHNNMIHYMKPMSDSTEKAASALNLRYPAKSLTHAEVKRQKDNNNVINASSTEEYAYPPLNSRFRYGTSKAIKFDGATGILTCYGDEFGKSTELSGDPNEWLKTMNEATFSNILGKKRGFTIMTSTAEEISSETLARAVELYNESNPEKRLSTGSTMNRCIRIFRGVSCRGFETIVADRWGFIDEEAVINAVTDKYNAMVEAGNVKGAISFIRKNPRTIEDVFMSSNDQSQFNTENLVNRQTSLELEKPRPWVRGNLKWADGEKDSMVVWEPNPNGRWVISKHPKDFNIESNRKGYSDNFSPMNKMLFAMGVDPIDQQQTLTSDEKRSKLGFTVMRRFDKYVDSSPGLYYKDDDEIKGIKKGDPIDLGAANLTNKVCCTYIHRSDDIFENFEDVLMTAIYYGTDFLAEKQRAGALHTYVRKREHSSFITDKATNVSNYNGKKEEEGVHATTKSWQDIFSYLETYISKWANSLDHPDLIGQLLTTNYKNKGERDLSVSFGWTLYHAYQKPDIKKNSEKNNEETEGSRYWDEEEI